MSSKLGKIAERKFELLCLERDIPCFIPTIDNCGVDYVIQSKSRLLRIQVKSTYGKSPNRNAYKINTAMGNDNRKYEKGMYDVLVVYIFDISTYYIIPSSVIDAKCIRLNPDSIKGKYNKYKEAWHLITA